jgi:Uri superfamily endonuclease
VHWQPLTLPKIVINNVNHSMGLLTDWQIDYLTRLSWQLSLAKYKITQQSESEKAHCSAAASENDLGRRFGASDNCPLSTDCLMMLMFLCYSSSICK